jgi:hypothetical protein
MYRLRLYIVVPTEIYGPGWNVALVFIQVNTSWGFSIQSEMYRLRYSLVPVKNCWVHSEMCRLRYSLVPVEIYLSSLKCAAVLAEMFRLLS